MNWDLWENMQIHWAQVCKLSFLFFLLKITFKQIVCIKDVRGVAKWPGDLKPHFRASLSQGPCGCTGKKKNSLQNGGDPRIFEVKRILKVFYPIFLILKQRSTKCTQPVTSQSWKPKFLTHGPVLFSVNNIASLAWLPSVLTRWVSCLMPHVLRYLCWLKSACLTNAKYILTHLQDFRRFHYLKIHFLFHS